MGEEVEYPTIARKALDEPAVVALVAVEAGLLSAFKLGDEMETALLEGRLARQGTGDRLRDERQPLLAAGREIAEMQDGRTGEDPPESLVGRPA